MFEIYFREPKNDVPAVMRMYGSEANVSRDEDFTSFLRLVTPAGSMNSRRTIFKEHRTIKFDNVTY